MLYTAATSLLVILHDAIDPYESALNVDDQHSVGKLWLAIISRVYVVDYRPMQPIPRTLSCDVCCTTGMALTTILCYG